MPVGLPGEQVILMHPDGAGIVGEDGHPILVTLDENGEIPANCNCCKVTTGCCENKLPRTITGTVSALSSGAYSAFAGQSFPLLWDADSQKWVGTFEGLTVRVYCSPVGDPVTYVWNWDIVGGTACDITGSTFNPFIVCDPFYLAYAGYGDCGDGIIVLEFSE